MKRIILAWVVLLAAVSASWGLLGNVSLSQSVPVRVPSHATVVPSQTTVLDDKGGVSTNIEPGDDKGGVSTNIEPGDDKGGLSTNIEPGDDESEDSGSKKVDTGGYGSSSGGRDDGSGHS